MIRADRWRVSLGVSTMHRKRTSAVVDRSIDDVFAWVTTPRSWLQVSPVTLRIDTPEPDRPLRAGDRLKQFVRIHDWRGHFDWTVELLDEPNRCVLTGVSSGDEFVSRLT